MSGHQSFRRIASLLCWILFLASKNVLGAPVNPSNIESTSRSNGVEAHPTLAKRLDRAPSAHSLTAGVFLRQGNARMHVLLSSPAHHYDTAMANHLEACQVSPSNTAAGAGAYWRVRDTTASSLNIITPLANVLNTLHHEAGRAATLPHGAYKVFEFKPRFLTGAQPNPPIVCAWNPVDGVMIRTGEVKRPTASDRVLPQIEKEFRLEAAIFTAQWHLMLKGNNPYEHLWDRFNLHAQDFHNAQRSIRFLVDASITNEETLSLLNSVARNHEGIIDVSGTYPAGSEVFQKLLGTVNGAWVAELFYMYGNAGTRIRSLGRRVPNTVTVLTDTSGGNKPVLIWGIVPLTLQIESEISAEMSRIAPALMAGPPPPPPQ